MNFKSLPLHICLLIIMSGCVFISEPDVGASAPGPEFGDADPEGEVDDRGAPSEVGNMESGNGGTGGSSGGDGVTNADGDGMVDSTDDTGVAAEEDAQIEATQDGAIPPMDGGMAAGDLGVAQEDASTGELRDMNVSDMSDATVIVPERDCSDIVWDCTEVGYCDPTNRDECALTPGQPACYEFQTPDTTDPEAYARCCAAAGECNRGNFCEPQDEAFSFCWLNGAGASCYIGANPISAFLCR